MDTIKNTDKDLNKHKKRSFTRVLRYQEEYTRRRRNKGTEEQKFFDVPLCKDVQIRRGMTLYDMGKRIEG